MENIRPEAIKNDICESRKYLDGLSENEIKRLEYEYFNLNEHERFQILSRWKATSFFILSSFGITGLIFTKLLDIVSLGDFRLALLFSPLLLLGPVIYLFALLIYKRERAIAYAIRDYLNEFLGPALGLCSLNFIISSLTKPKMLGMFRLLIIGLYIYIFVVVFGIALLLFISF